MLGAVVFVAGQIALLMIAFQVYRLVRRIVLQQPQEVAFDHALQILRWEKWLGIDVELDLQRRIVEHDWMFWFFNRYYMGFMWLFYACAAAAMLLAPARYRYLRRAFLLSMLLALPWFETADADAVRGLIDAAPQVEVVVLYQPDMDEDGQLREAAAMLASLGKKETYEFDGLVIAARPTDALKQVEEGVVAGSLDRKELIELSPPAVIRAEALRAALDGSAPGDCLTSLIAHGGRLRWRPSFSSSAGSA